MRPGRRGRRPLQMCGDVTAALIVCPAPTQASLLREVARRSRDGGSRRQRLLRSGPSKTVYANKGLLILPQSASLTAPSRGSQRFEHYRRPGNQPGTCQFSLTREERRGRSPLQIMTVRPSENVTMRIIPRKEGRGRPSPRATKTAPGHPGAENGD